MPLAAITACAVYYASKLAFCVAFHLWALPIPIKGCSPLKPRKGIIPLTFNTPV